MPYGFTDTQWLQFDSDEKSKIVIDSLRSNINAQQAAESAKYFMEQHKLRKT